MLRLNQYFHYTLCNHTEIGELIWRTIQKIQIQNLLQISDRLRGTINRLNLLQIAPYPTDFILMPEVPASADYTSCYSSKDNRIYQTYCNISELKLIYIYI